MADILRSTRFITNSGEFEVMECAGRDMIIFDVAGVNVTVAVSSAQWAHFKSAPFLPDDDGGTRERGIEGVYESIAFRDGRPAPDGGGTVTLRETDNGASLIIEGEGTTEEFDDGRHEFTLTLEQWRVLLSLDYVSDDLAPPPSRPPAESPGSGTVH